MIHISAKTFDLSGVLDITPLPNSSPGQLTRRVNRVPTLDGGIAVNDGGFSHGDRDVDIIYRPVSTAHDDIARRIVELHSRVCLSLPDGLFEAAPGSFDPAPDQNTFTLLIISKLSED